MADDFAANNPLNKLYDQIWAMLEAHSGFTDAVLENNRIKHNVMHNPELDSAAEADLPQVMVIPAAFTPNPLRSSNGSSVIVTWSILVRTGTRRLDDIFLPVVWNIYCALADWISQLATVTWKTQDFVKICRPTAASAEIMTPEGLLMRGWVSVWAVDTELWFTTDSLTP